MALTQLKQKFTNDIFPGGYLSFNLMFQQNNLRDIPASYIIFQISIIIVYILNRTQH